MKACVRSGALAVIALTVAAVPGCSPAPAASQPPASPGHDLLITAAHCIHGGKGGGYRQDIVFIPGYLDGQAPSGIWTPAQLIVPPPWPSRGRKPSSRGHAWQPDRPSPQVIR
jgi:hypothetical protein